MSIDDTENDYKIHIYSIEGKKSKLKAALNRPKQKVNALDFNGNTALYYACLNQKKECVKLLLDYNADPNERCSKGRTPMHAAAIIGDVKIMKMLLAKGGDLRYHDDEGRTARDFVNLIMNPEVKQNLLNIMDNAPLIPAPKVMNEYQQTSLCPSLNCIPSQTEYSTPNSVKKSNETSQTIAVNYIEETELTHDPNGLTANNGAFMVYEAMKWKEKLLVTVKRLHLTPVDGAYVDLLIHEQNILSHISYQKIIQLIGVAQSPLNERLSLVFERVQYGSLFNILHENQSKGVKIRNLVEIISSICEAIIYLHEQKILHCYINSHSVLMVTAHTPKLANFEYAVHKASDSNQQKKSKVVENKHTNYAWNWLAPELMLNDLPHEKSDMYSFCAFIWELFNMQIPWKDLEWSDIRYKIHNESETLPVDLSLIPFPFNRILKDGLSYNAIKRMSFEEVKSSLDNFRESIRLRTQLKSNKKNIYTNDVKKIQPKNGMIYSDYGAETINDTPIANEMATYNSEDFANESRSQFSSKSFICCDAYKAEIHLTKGGLSMISKETRHRSTSKNRAHSSRHDKSKRKHNLSESQQKTPKSTDYHIDSVGLMSITSKVLPPHPPPPPPLPIYQNNEFVPFMPTPPPPPPPLPPNIQPFSNKSKSNISIKSKKRDSLPQLPTPDELSSHSSRFTQQFINQSKFTSIIDDNPSDTPLPAGFLTPTTTPKNPEFKKSAKITKHPSLSNNQMIEELKIRNGSSNSLRMNQAEQSTQMESTPLQQQPILSQATKNKNQLQDVLNRQYRRIEEHDSQQKIQIEHQQQQLQQQTTPDYDYSQVPASSTPINVARTRGIFQRQQIQQQQNDFDRHNLNRASQNSYMSYTDNLCQPTPDDKVKYFSNKNSEDSNECHQPNKNSCRKLSISGGSPIEDKTDENQVANRNETASGSGSRNSSAETKKIYSNVRKSTIVSKNDDDSSNNNTANNFKANNTSSVSVAQLVSEHLSMSMNNINKPPTQIDVNTILKKTKTKHQAINLLRSGSYNRINTDQETKNYCDVFKKNGEQQQEQRPQQEYASKRSSSFSDSRSQSQQSSINTNKVKQQQQGHQSRIKAFTADQTDNPEFYGNYGAVRNLVNSYESIKEQTDNEIRMRHLREERNREIADAVECSKQAHIAALAAQSQVDENNNNEPVKIDKPEQTKLQKELSTISERTEQTSLLNNGNANKAASSNTLTAASPANTNLNSKSTSVTKSVRNFNLNQLNYLDTSNAISGDGYSTRNNPNLSGNSSAMASTPKTVNLSTQHEFFPTKKSTLQVQSNQPRLEVDYDKYLKNLKDFARQSYNELKREIRSEIVQEEVYEEDEVSEPDQEHYNSRFTKSNNETRNSTLQDKIDKSTSNKQRINSKSNYSSQEDFLSSMNNGDNLTSFEVSESVYLTVFDKTSKAKDNTLKNKNLTIDEDQEFPSVPHKFMVPINDMPGYNSTAITPPPPPPPPPVQTNFNFNLSSNQKISKDLPKTSFSNRPRDRDSKYCDSSSSSSNIAVSSASSLSSTNSTSTNSCKNHPSNADVRLEQHFIDTSKYKGYQYKLETRSNVSNLYHIESSLTNANTGHSLLLAKTRVQTPKISTKIIIDR